MEAMVKNSFMRLFQIFLMNILCFIRFVGIRNKSEKEYSGEKLISRFIIRGGVY